MQNDLPHFLLQVHRRRSVHSMQPHKLQIWLALSILGLGLGLIKIEQQRSSRAYVPLGLIPLVDVLVSFEIASSFCNRLPFPVVML